MAQLATCQEIQKWVEREFGFHPETSWIAHCQELHGLPLFSEEPAAPCPPEKRPPIEKAFRHFGMLA